MRLTRRKHTQPRPASPHRDEREAYPIPNPQLQLASAYYHEPGRSVLYPFRDPGGGTNEPQFVGPGGFYVPTPPGSVRGHNLAPPMNHLDSGYVSRSLSAPGDHGQDIHVHYHQNQEQQYRPGHRHSSSHPQDPNYDHNYGYGPGCDQGHQPQPHSREAQPPHQTREVHNTRNIQVMYHTTHHADTGAPREQRTRRASVVLPPQHRDQDRQHHSQPRAKTPTPGHVHAQARPARAKTPTQARPAQHQTQQRLSPRPAQAQTHHQGQTQQRLSPRPAQARPQTQAQHTSHAPAPAPQAQAHRTRPQQQTHQGTHQSLSKNKPSSQIHVMKRPAHHALYALNLPFPRPSHLLSHILPNLPPVDDLMYFMDNKKEKGSVFQYSRCSGRKRALCIGINYKGLSNPLNGCINDTKNVKHFLIKYHSFHSKDIRMLTDDTSDPSLLPTRQNIISSMKWLVEGAKANDSLFFHYSGHGGQTEDVDGDEEDGFDEVIFPLDYKKKGIILDDKMNEIMVRNLPKGCRLTALFDSCHSGTVLDLPFNYTHDGKVKVSHFNMPKVSNNNLKNGITPSEEKRARAYTRENRSTCADVICWAGCKDSETSADTEEDGEAVGAMSYAFINCLKRDPKQSYADLLISVREVLAQRYNQRPQLSSSHPIDTKYMFVI